MSMDGISYWRIIWWLPSVILLWPPWILAITAFFLTIFGRRVAALVTLLTGFLLVLLGLVIGSREWLLTSPWCHGGHGCVDNYWMFHHILLVAWTPFVFIGIPVLLRVPWRELDGSFRRALMMAGVMALDTLALIFGPVYLISLVCEKDHGAGWLFGL